MDISAKEYYFQKLRPEIDQFCATYKTDSILLASFEEVMNKTDTQLIKEEYQEVYYGSFQEILKVITSSNYDITGAGRRSSEAERQARKEVITKISIFLGIVRASKKTEPQTEDNIQRIGWDDNKKENVLPVNSQENEAKRTRIPNIL